MILDYLSKRWFLVLTFVGIWFAIKYPGPSRQFFDQIEIRHVGAVGLFIMSVSLSTRRLWGSILRPGPALLAIAVSWGVAPLLAYFAAPILLPPKFQTGLIVVCCVPCSMASASIWTRMGGGNEAVALMVTMITNVFVFLGTSAWVVALTGREVQFELREMITVLLLYVVLPILAGQAFRSIRPIGWWIDEHRQIVKVVSQIMVLLIIIKSAVLANTELAAKAAAGQQRQTWNAFDLVQCGLVCVAVHVVLAFVGFLTAKRLFSHEDAVAVGISGSQKTLPVAAILVTTYFRMDPFAIVPVLFFHVGQLIVDTYIAEYVFLRPGDQPTRIEEPLIQA